MNNLVTIFIDLNQICLIINHSRTIQYYWIRMHLSIYIAYILCIVRFSLVEYTNIHILVVYAVTAGMSCGIISLLCGLGIPSGYNALIKPGIAINTKYIIKYIGKLSVLGFFLYLTTYTIINLLALYISDYIYIFTDVCFMLGIIHVIENGACTIVEEGRLMMNNNGNGNNPNPGGPGGSDWNRPPRPPRPPLGILAGAGQPTGDHGNQGNFSHDNPGGNDRTSLGRGGGLNGPALGPWYNTPFATNYARWDSTPERLLGRNGIPMTPLGTGMDGVTENMVPNIPNGLIGQFAHQMLLDNQALQNINKLAKPFVDIQIAKGVQGGFVTSVLRHLEVMSKIVWMRNGIALGEHYDRGQLFGAPPYQYDSNYWNSRLDVLQEEYYRREQILRAQYNTLTSDMSPLRRALLQQKLGTWPHS